jgi:hypothetical protein
MEVMQMKKITCMTGFMGYMLFALTVLAAPSPAPDVQDIQVGRIYYIEGELLRYIPEENDWVAVVSDAPFGTEDTLFSGSKGMAEMFIPNGAWIRIGNNTQIQFISLEPDLTETDIASGMARFYNKGSGMVIKTTTPFGYVLSDPNTVFDLYVGANSAEVIAIKGIVSFVHEEGNAKYNVSAGSPSLIADQDRVAPGDGTVDLAWDQWNKNRDIIWADRLGEDSRSARYLPKALRHEAYCFDANGRWEMVYYEGRNCWFWRPIRISVGWSPFTIGYWTEWCGDQTWIPLEPFGYITHHYGNWVYIRNCWYWAPPVVGFSVNLPFLDIGFFWYPGRVSWIFRGAYIGWVPLSPRETYYSHHNWGGPHHKIVQRDNNISVGISIRNYAYSDHAVIVRKDHFRGVDNYRDVRVSNIHPNIINNYNAAAVVNETVIKNYTEDRRRHNYANTVVSEKPRPDVITRIRQNVTAIHKDRKEDAAEIHQRLKLIPDGRVNRHTRIEAPAVTAHMEPSTPTRRQGPTEQTERPARPTPFQEQERSIGSRQATAPSTVRRPRPSEQVDRTARPTPFQEQERSIGSRQATAPTAIQRPRPPEQADRPASPTPSQEQEAVTQPGQIRSSGPAGADSDRNNRIKRLVNEENQKRAKE